MCTKSVCKAITAASLAGILTYAVCKASSRQKRRLKIKASKLLKSCEGVIDVMSSMLHKCC